MSDESVAIWGLSEPVFRVGAFLVAFSTFAILEAWRPRRVRLQSRRTRWFTNGGMLIISTLFVRLILLFAPLLAITTAATLAAEMNWGLFNNIHSPYWLQIILAFTLLDFAIWLQHLLSHKIPLLWKFHRVHHSDRDLDASSALRFHPVEIVFSTVYKLGVVLLVGPAIVAVILFEVILNASALFNHANLALPHRFDRLIRAIIVTPDMHRIHHSIHRHEHDTNYGFCLSVWDRLFGTYTARPSGGQTNMTIGLSPYQTRDTEKITWSLMLPFR